ALAGAIVEVASGESYPDYLRAHVFAAAGMKDSSPNNAPDPGARLVTPYTHLGPQGPVADWQVAPADLGSPAGGAISTAADLVRFAAALASGKLVSSAMFREMTTARGNAPWGGGYGLAMEIDDVDGQTVVGHGGGFPGVSTHLYLLPGTPYSLVVLSNQDPPADAYASTRLLALLAEKVRRDR
ncbi:MAG: beta-lactamase family protein, partial [Proteobacteria bacterium]|nr:beta-lactamase family protein [Pseudomonadota bacterium]